MDSFLQQRSLLSDRFLDLFSQPEALSAAGASGITGVELDEDEVLWTEGNFSSLSHSPATASPNHGATFSPSSSRSFRRLPEKNSGILAALPEEEKRRDPRSPRLLQSRTPMSSSPSTSSSPSSSARMIPVAPKPKQEYSLSVPSGTIRLQSAPVNVPMRPRRISAGYREQEMYGTEEADDDELLPPHEIVARASGMGSPMTTFSVLEGAGRTLKGRDLRRVRNAVWHQTGFLD